MRVSPNPFARRFTVFLEANQEEAAQLNLFSTDGQAVLRRTVNIQAGKNEIELDPQDIPPGQYALHVRTLNSNVFILVNLEKQSN